MKKKCIACEFTPETAQRILSATNNAEPARHLCLDCEDYLYAKPNRKLERHCEKCNSKLSASRYYKCESCVPELESEDLPSQAGYVFGKVHRRAA